MVKGGGGGFRAQSVASESNREKGYTLFRQNELENPGNDGALSHLLLVLFKGVYWIWILKDYFNKKRSLRF